MRIAWIAIAIFFGLQTAAFGLDDVLPSSRLLAMVGSSSLSTPQSGSQSGGFAATVLGDFGVESMALETGLLTLHSMVMPINGAQPVPVQIWGIPVLGKYNFWHNPRESFFVKIGGMTYWSNRGSDILDLMGIAGCGLSVWLGNAYSLVFDASYDYMMTASTGFANVRGPSFIMGIQVEE